MAEIPASATALFGAAAAPLTRDMFAPSDTPAAIVHERSPARGPRVDANAASRTAAPEVAANPSPVDRDLADLVAAWDKLPAKVRAAVAAIARVSVATA